MITSDLKIELIQKIIESSNLDLLLRIKEIIEASDSYHVNARPFVYQNLVEVRVFSDLEQAKIDKAMIQYQNGDCISDDEAQKEIQEWLED
jgi:hypothetical protein